MQAYTVELEAELNQLREENSQLKQALVLPNNINYYRIFDSFSLVIQLY
jgi:hypothetical protein